MALCYILFHTQHKPYQHDIYERIFAYSPVENIRDPKSPKPFKKVDQIQYIIDALSDVTYTRRAQAITWMPTADPQTGDPPCLQRIWCRLVEDGAGHGDARDDGDPRHDD